MGHDILRMLWPWVGNTTATGGDGAGDHGCNEGWSLYQGKKPRFGGKIAMNGLLDEFL